MISIQLTARQVLDYIILGIKNGRYQEALNLAQDYTNAMDEKEKEKEEEKKD